jgi:hypothetical protein
MGSIGNNSQATDSDSTKTVRAGERPDRSEPTPADCSDGMKRGRDNSAAEADEWLAGGVEEAGYGYGV